MKTTCREILEILADYDTPDCTAEEKALIDGHLDECAACQKVLASQRKLISGLKAEAEQLRPGTPLFKIPESAKPSIWSLIFAEKFNVMAFGATAFLVAFLLVWHLFAGLQTHQPNLPEAAQLFTTAQGELKKMPDSSYHCRSEVLLQIPELEIRLSKGSEFAATSSEQLKLISGSALCRVTPGKRSFSVITPHAEVSVTGTLFETLVTTESTRIALHEGKLLISNPGARVEMTASETCEFFKNATYRKIRPPEVASTTPAVIDPPAISSAATEVFPAAPPDVPASSSSDSSSIESNQNEADDERPVETPDPQTHQGIHESPITSPEDTLLGN